MQKIHQSNHFTEIVSVIDGPLQAILNSLVRIFLTMFLPFPIPDEIIMELRASILQILFILLLVLILTVVSLIGIFTLPLTHQVTTIAPASDSSFSGTDVPFQNPLGGIGLSFVRITAYFHDSDYYAQFGLWHEGVDFVPSDAYYKQSTAYNAPKNVNHDIDVFSTINGVVTYYQDQYGSHTIEVLNNEGTLKVIFMHLNDVFVSTGQSITAGTPVGTMGDTGFSTGEHLHYQIDISNNDSWTPIDPLGYIKQ